MHEMSLAESVLQIIEEAALSQNFTKVKTVILEVGQLASIEIEAMHFCFDAVMSGSVAEGATLQIIDIPGMGQCRKCAAAIKMSELYGICPICGSYETYAVSGLDMRVKELEVE